VAGRLGNESVAEMGIREQRISALDMQFLDQFRELDSSGGLSLVKRIMQVYLDTSGEIVLQVEQAVSAEDAEMLRRAAHSLKSSSANVGAARLSELFHRLEMMGRERELDKARPFLATVRQAYSDVTDEIRALLVAEVPS
jgi:two-component system, sensor histidine kinase and response regulator